MAGDNNGDELDGRTVMQAPTFDELVAERERQQAAAGTGPTDPSGLDPNDKTAMAPSFDERLAMANTAMGPSYDQRSPAPVAPDPFAPPPAANTAPKADMPPPWAAPGSAGPASPMATSPAPQAPQAAAAQQPPAQQPPAQQPPAANAPGQAPAAGGDGVLPKTMMLNAEDWGGVVPPPGTPGGPLPGQGPPPGAPAGAAPGYGAPPGAPALPAGAAPAPARPGMNPMVLFFAGLAVTFVVGSCLVGIVLAFVL